MFTHVVSRSLQVRGEVWSDGGGTKTADTETGLDGVVNANGGGANAISIAFPAAGLQSLVLLASVPCVVTLTGATVIDGVTTGAVTLEANVLRQVTAITGNVTDISVGANTVSSGPAGTIKISALFNS